MRLLLINPVGTSLWDELVRNYVAAVLPSDVELVVKHLPGAPLAIESEYDKALAEALVVNEVMKAQREGFHAVIVNCFDDPGVEASRDISTVPVLGIGETSITTALLLGRRIAIISTGKASRVLYIKRAMELGLDKRLAYAGGIEVPVLELRKDVEAVKGMLVEEAKRAINDYGAEVIVLGCGALIGLAEWLAKEVGAPVVDPTLVTVKTAEMLVRLGLTHSTVYRPKLRVMRAGVQRP